MLKTTISELEDSLGELNSKLDIAEEKISEFKDKGSKLYPN